MDWIMIWDWEVRKVINERNLKHLSFKSKEDCEKSEGMRVP